MRLLIVSFAFPPHNSIGAVRVSKTAKYLLKHGHDVRILAAKDQPYPATLPLEIPPPQIVYSKWLSLRKTSKNTMGETTAKSTAVNGKATSKTAGTTALKDKLITLSRTLLYFPDAYIGWFPFAVPAAAALFKDWRPDFILASSPPFTSLLVAARLSRKHNVPWVADLRDLWVDNHYHKNPAWRKIVEEKLERRVLSSAAGVVTVSTPLAEVVRRKYGKPTAVVLNGFDSDDYPAQAATASGKDYLRIIYTGVVYEGKRDPSLLFKALRELGALAEKVRVVFYGAGLGIVRELAVHHEVGHLVEVNNPIPYGESLKMQREADILLLLLWNDLAERGVYTGKLFEYMGARRPIMVVGGAETVAAELVRERRLGIVAKDSIEIANQLRKWIEQKQRCGSIAALPEEIVAGVSREEQTRVLEDYLCAILQQH